MRMVGGPDWKQTRTKVTAYLGHDEPLESLFTALVPPPERGGLTISVLVLPVVWAVWLVTWQAAVRKSSRAAQVPLARRMIVALTPRRLVIWKASSRWRLRAIAGDLPRDRVASIAVSGSGSRSRTLILHLTTGASITMKVAPESANRLRDLM
jgi:hypothetical protein